jgi:hypothetical protein
MTALEMLEALASVGYKACWYARRVGENPVPHIRVSYPVEGGPAAYHVNDKPGTREQAQELLEQNIRPAWEGIHTPSQAKT